MTTFLLIHGAWHTGRAWDRVTPLLEAAGHRVFAPTLTGYGDTAHLLSPEIGLDTHIDDVLGVIEANDLHDVVLVGHSYAGMVVSGVVDRLPERIARVVFLDAMVPEDGQSAVDVLPVTQQMIDAAVDGWRVPPMPQQPPPRGLFGVTDPVDVAWLRSMLSDQPVRCLQQPVRLNNPAARTVPRSHIHCTAGRPDGVGRAAVPDGERVWELQTGHDCMITQPAELAAVLVEIALLGSADGATVCVVSARNS
ncbi:alpha/beta fold hydrolase [Microlunatus soli]|uniref:Alpha/beta hydrolase family protein n=1 Tax=Microlunatus soli TaxID=630515 RepID=A0A1H1PW73_9ACTN|nr:alpha/beta fold hydrolase [Microlunatus soli]SDS15346.1 Alpha/beta hydrolase family protein [Microlunatus soli]